MKKIIKGTPLETSGKRLANHSARKTVVKKLKAASFSEESIVKVTGHKNKFRDLSLAIDSSKENNLQYNSLSREINSGQNFYNCTVTINVTK